MQKSTRPITQPAHLDYDLSERLARHLQASWLHVHAATVVMSMPKEIADPRWPTAELVCDLVMLTDGARGWLMLFDDQDTWDVPRELNEFLDDVARETGHGVPFAFRAVETRDSPRPGVVDLRDMKRATTALESLFESQFRGSTRTDVEALLAAFATFGYPLWDEDTIRARMSLAA